LCRISCGAFESFSSGDPIPLTVSP
jgi:hypothetical protein